MKRSHLAILINVLAWIPRAYSLCIYFQPQVNMADPRVRISFLLSLESGVEAFVMFYISYFFLSPLLFSKNKEKIRYALWFGAIVVLVISGIGYCVTQAISPNYMGITWYWPINIILLNVYAAFMAYLTKVFLNWYSDIFYKQQLEKKNLETELALLKAQINPHFLFNTLNNIDVLIEKDSDTASVYLKKLSDILRFMLYESPSEIIPLTQELEYIRKYIELQKIRTSNSNYVTFQAEGDTGHIMIAPMLFIPFIENAFKHSVNKKIDHAIDVKLVAGQKGIVFECNNAYDPAALQTQPKSGLGLELIKNRLKLLYNDNYNLKIDKSDNRFIVNLTINGNQLHYN